MKLVTYTIEIIEAESGILSVTSTRTEIPVHEEYAKELTQARLRTQNQIRVPLSEMYDESESAAVMSVAHILEQHESVQAKEGIA
jgi:hypothetical protein